MAANDLAFARGIIQRNPALIYAGAACEGLKGESTPLVHPTHLYTATKLAGEAYTLSYNALYGGEHTILLSTHILSEVEMTCQRAIIIHHGQVAAAGNLAELTKSRGSGAKNLMFHRKDGSVAYYEGEAS